MYPNLPSQEPTFVGPTLANDLPFFGTTKAKLCIEGCFKKLVRGFGICIDPLHSVYDL
jgi:hypothetical protein